MSPFTVVDAHNVICFTVVGIGWWIGLVFYLVAINVVFDCCKHDAVGDSTMRTPIQVTPEDIVASLLCDSENGYTTLTGLPKVSSVGNIQVLPRSRERKALTGITNLHWGCWLSMMPQLHLVNIYRL